MLQPTPQKQLWDGGGQHALDKCFWRQARNYCKREPNKERRSKSKQEDSWMSHKTNKSPEEDSLQYFEWVFQSVQFNTSSDETYWTFKTQTLLAFPISNRRIHSFTISQYQKYLVGKIGKIPQTLCKMPKIRGGKGCGLLQKYIS